MTSLSEGPLWYAVAVRSQHELGVANILEHKGFDLFVPTYRCRRGMSQRVREKICPLFPGYIFCRFDARYRMPILLTDRVLYIVSLCGQPQPVDTAEVEAIQLACRSALKREPWEDLTIGRKAMIVGGPLRGLMGTVVGDKGEHRLILSVTLLQRSVAVEVCDEWVEPVPDSHSGLTAATMRATPHGR